jgi:hypothetical protein
MEAKTQTRVASVLTLLLGIWVGISPLFISVTGAALVSTIATGVALGVFSLLQMFVRNGVPSWLNGLAGIWLIISSFAFTVTTAMGWSLVLSGIAAVILAIWDGNEVEETYGHPMRA